MPEGDTIHRIARAMSVDLPGRPIDRLETSDLGVVSELNGRSVHRVDVHGKHLLLHIDSGWTLRVHLGMHGTWFRQSADAPLPHRPTAAVTAGDTSWICTRAYRAELVRTGALRTHPRLARLGPDILEIPLRIDAIMARVRLAAHTGREIADVLLDQRVASGIGNVYKSEVLFAARIHPCATIGALSDNALRAAFETAARLMNENLRTRRRTSVPLRRRPQPASERLFVYGRGGKPCLDCGMPIRRILQGDFARSTYWCEHCQPAAPAEPVAG